MSNVINITKLSSSKAKITCCYTDSTSNTAKSVSYTKSYECVEYPKLYVLLADLLKQVYPTLPIGLYGDFLAFSEMLDRATYAKDAKLPALVTKHLAEAKQIKQKIIEYCSREGKFTAIELAFLNDIFIALQRYYNLE